MITYQASQTEKFTASIGEQFRIISETAPQKIPSGSWEPYIKLPDGIRLVEQKAAKEDGKYVFELKIEHALKEGTIYCGYVDAANNTSGEYKIGVEAANSGGAGNG
ncbi:MAG: hypothetical protein WBB45_14730 [Cyclobacteriaceae bacterium]